MTSAHKTNGRRVSSETFKVCMLLILFATGCAGSAHKQGGHKLNRLGESVTVPDDERVVSNALVAWALKLTNGYVLLDDRATRLKHLSLRNTQETLFSLRNGTNFTSPWGRSVCLPSEEASYWAEVIIRIRSVATGSTVSVAIHGRHFVTGRLFNIHTYKFDQKPEVELPPCPQDEQAVVKELESILRKAEETNLPRANKVGQCVTPNRAALPIRRGKSGRRPGEALASDRETSSLLETF